MLVKVNKIRHFHFVRDRRDFTTKRDGLVWRGNARRPNRQAFLRDYFGHPRCDVGDVIRKRHAPQQPGSVGMQMNKLTGQSRREEAEVVREPRTILYHDDSNVGVEFQVTEMVKNQMQHNMALTIMSNQLRLLETAISERL